MTLEQDLMEARRARAELENLERQASRVPELEHEAERQRQGRVLDEARARAQQKIERLLNRRDALGDEYVTALSAATEKAQEAARLLREMRNVESEAQHTAYRYAGNRVRFIRQFEEPGYSQLNDEKHVREVAPGGRLRKISADPRKGPASMLFKVVARLAGTL